MKSIKITFLLACVLSMPRVMAQSPVVMPGNFESVTIGSQDVTFKTTNSYGKISVYSPSIIRIRLDKKPLNADFSYAVVGKPMAVKAQITQTDNEIDISTDSLKAVIQKKPFSVSFFTIDGKVINQDEQGLTTSWVNDAVTTYKKMQDDEHFVGLGEKTGNLDRKGNGYTNWNSDVYGYNIAADPLYSTIPFYVGIHHGLNYGIFMDNSYQSDFNFGASNNRFSSFGARGGEMNYYFIYHKKLADIIASYTWLTGRMPLPPKWALGYQQNRYSYYPEAEVMRIANTLREKRIPADGITLDIHYMDRYQLFTWNKNRFPDPAKMSAELNKLGLKLTVIVDPGIKVEKGAPAYESGLAKDVYIKYPDGTPYTGQVWPGWCNFTDFTSEKGRAWWRGQVDFFAKSGVSGIWNDMNEISTWGQKMPDNVLFDFDGRKTTHLEAHNVYGLEMVRSSYEGALEHFKERPFILSRSGYAGLQRYSAIWTGDNRAEEDHMLAGVRLMNSLGLSGVSFTGMDIGGFTGNPTTSLYTRWIELGAFVPYYRNHTALNSRAAEPWAFGEDVLDIARSYISMRYQLMPYLYSSFYESTQNGMPVMRSLAINYTFDPKVMDATYQNQYEFGNGFMVAPFESTAAFGKVYFPEGKWYDLYTGAEQKGAQEVTIPVSVNKLPVYVKGGSIIPMQSLTQSTAELPTDTLAVHIYKGDKPNHFVYYEDDGKSFGYQKGDFYKRTISFDPDKKTISFDKAEGTYKTNFKYIRLVLHGFEQTTSIKTAGNNLKLQDDAIAFLGAAANTDPQGSVNAPDKSPVKTVTISNTTNNIQINY
ncbi:TIM-barrel domain-containing protein [Mucilaginibacter flavus]|uniref:glycoside hydrolase family 31 protein n=1 Tax=Mucilaginibacter flavus TaxID=931504 RepID=UPI0025B2D9F1|nr:TIM-barrel domain-containing protein [Mucilaginibacter flavus]MDN3582131.1 glycoside hydrolase family 31 protein [Mucilaginibacter flavus]